jgi:hypothetical protein
MAFDIALDAGKSGQIHVTEDQENFLVKIHYRDKDRAKMIAGRQWDGKRSLWVYPKNPETYDALLEQFKRDADVFDIRRPKTKRPAGIEATETTEVDDENDWTVLSEIGQGQTRLQEELTDIRNALGVLSESFRHHQASIDRIDESQNEIRTRVLASLGSDDEPQSNENATTNLSEIDIEDDAHLQIFEEAMKEIAYSSSDFSEDFGRWILKHKPITRPLEFVSETHELLKEQLERIVPEASVNDSFYDLIHRARDENVIYSPKGDPIQIFPTLMTLNVIRNRFSHARNFDDAEKRNRAITYLMNLALVWPKIMMDSSDEE